MYTKSGKIFLRGISVLFLIGLFIQPVNMTSALAAGNITRVSVDSGGAQANDRSMRPAISADGRYVAFESFATNLVGGSGGLFLKDRQSGATTRVAFDGENAAISGDGRFIAFDSFANNIIIGDTNDLNDVFIYDRQSGATTRVSVNSSGAQANGQSQSPAISGDGRFVAFISDATNLVSSDSNGVSDIFVRDLVTGVTELVSIATGGAQANAAPGDVSISSDGRIVVFCSGATNLVSGDTNSNRDVFARDRQSGLTTRVSVNSSGVEADRGACDSSVSGNGRFVSFSSFSTNLMSQDSLEFEHIYVRDLQTGTTTLASSEIGGTPMVERSEQSVLSADGRYVAFQFDDKGDGMARFYIYVHDRQTGLNTVASGGGAALGSGGFSSSPSISADGRFVAFASDFTALVPDDTNGMPDIFVRELSFGQDLPPTVSSVAPICGFSCALPTPTTVSFRVTFSEAVSGVTVDDFVLSSTGAISGASLTGVTGSNNEYVVSANTGVGDGTLRLDVLDDDSIRDIALNPLGGASAGNGNFTTGEIYIVDKNIPAVVGSTRVDPNPTANVYVNFAITFSEDVSGIDALDFIPYPIGNIVGSAVSEVTGSGKNYNVKVSTGSGEGSLKLNVIDNDSIRDVDNHPIGGDGADNGTFTHGEEYTISRIPAVLSSLRLDPNPTSADTVNFIVTFSKEVGGVDASDFTFATTGSLSGVNIVNVSGAGVSYTVTVNIGSGDGTLRLEVLDNDSITDVTANPLGGAGIGNGVFISGDIYSVDKNAPMVISSLRVPPNPTIADTVHFNVTFSEAVSGVDTSDFMLTTTDSLAGVSILAVNGSANTYTVTAATGSGNGSLRLDIIDNDSILDFVNHPLGGLGVANGNFNTGDFITINRVVIVPVITDFRSTGQRDGWVLEKNENSNTGGSKNSSASFIKLGDDAQDRQFRSILHFPTYYLPDNAVVTQVILMIKKQDVIGTDPFTTHQNIAIDIRKGLFSNYNFFTLWSLQLTDFQSPADVSSVGVIQNNPVSGWYWATLDSRAFSYINLTDITQIRLAFQLDDNDDMSEDSIRFYSGDAPSQIDRPHLQIEYYVPR